MKNTVRPLSKLLCLIMMLGIFAAFAVETSAYTYILGDADGSGDVDIVDATIVMRVVAEVVPDTDGKIAERCDIDGNGMDITSATWIQRWLAEIKIPYPVGEPVTVSPTENPTQKPTQKPTEEYELPIV